MSLVGIVAKKKDINAIRKEIKDKNIEREWELWKKKLF